MFPKYPEGSAPNKSCVTKVVVSFEKFKFVGEFVGEYDVKLIDLDRCVDVADGDLGDYVGEMYRILPDWTADKLDWKQLGLLAGRVITKYQNSDEAISGDQCLKSSLMKVRYLLHHMVCSHTLKSNVDDLYLL